MKSLGCEIKVKYLLLFSDLMFKYQIYNAIKMLQIRRKTVNSSRIESMIVTFLIIVAGESSLVGGVKRNIFKQMRS